MIEKIKESGANSIWGKQFLPHASEAASTGLLDPIGDAVHAKAGQLIHRYESRALFLPTTKCPVQCRYCFRKNELYSGDEMFKSEFAKTLQYLKDHPEINELIFSGGDPFFISNQKLDFYLEEFTKIQSLKTIRFHTRFGSVLPLRFDGNLLELLKKNKNHFENLVIIFHLNHQAEISEELEQVCKDLNSQGIRLLSQTVLLKSINDDADLLNSLFTKLDKIGIRPYYLHHPDLVKGAMHFYVELEEGQRIYKQLRRKLSGWNIPHYVVDLPGGEGKTPAANLSEEYILSAADKFSSKSIVDNILVDQ